MSWFRWKPYVPVAKRRAQARKRAEKMAKNGRPLAPVQISGRKIAATFWGQAWCDNLESYSDFENRLPRGRTYVRNGSVIDLAISSGQVKALVSGSDLYKVDIEIATLAAREWKTIRGECSRSIDSLMDLLQGRFSQGVMQRLTRQKDGLFPRPAEIGMKCSCPDWATLCKHVAAVLYGVGARLDTAPEMLFQLRGVDHLELIGHAVDSGNLDAALGSSAGAAFDGEDLSAMFGIDLEAPAASSSPAKGRTARKQASSAKTPARKATAKKQSTARKAAASKKAATGRKPASKQPATGRKKTAAARRTSDASAKGKGRKKT
ncbi:MAG: hypothetical protein KY476_14250 [Planctomycetes bacterium]|nr:hypothetical protein [Planctomycetota bacterium]